MDLLPIRGLEIFSLSKASTSSTAILVKVSGLEVTSKVLRIQISHWIKKLTNEKRAIQNLPESFKDATLFASLEPACDPATVFLTIDPETSDSTSASL